MLPNGLTLCVELALGPRAGADPAFHAAMVLGLLREDVLLWPGGRSSMNPSLDHVWPWARGRVARLHRRARVAKDRLRAAYHLGRAAHVLIDMACPVHAHGTFHTLHDPFERWVDANVDELATLPLPALDPRFTCPSALATSLARAARGETADGTQSPWGRTLGRLGLRRSLREEDVAPQARRLIPLAAAHVRRLVEGISRAPQ